MRPEDLKAPLRRVAVVGNHMPRQCGIATFTTDLCDALVAAYGQDACFVLAVDDVDESYAYPARVRYALPEGNLAAYRGAAEFLNLHNADVLCLQHEYGIFGGPAGSHILALLEDLRMPVVTTLHTVLAEPEPAQRLVLEAITRLSERLVVMTQRAADYLRNIYKVPADKIDLIPHGIPDVPFLDPNLYKDQFGAANQVVLLTFGLLSRDKGIESVIRALPSLRQRWPDLVYMVVGATHPHVRRHEGESYRRFLEALARNLGVEQQVRFYNRFVTLAELIEFIGAADFYVTPYLKPEQITSGTLAYTVGAGKAVISTPYWHAQELLADGRGVLVPFNDPGTIATSIARLLDDEAAYHAMRKRAYLLGREMIWSEVAGRYMASFARARTQRGRHAWAPAHRMAMTRDQGYPALNLDHLQTLTDDTGLLQHAVYTLPNRDEGYVTDDNARALILTMLVQEARRELPAACGTLATRYLAFLWHAFCLPAGRFRNFMAYDRRWLEAVGSEDSHGRALWALGTVLGRSRQPGFAGIAHRLFELALPAAESLAAPRAWAFTLLGIHEYLRRFPHDRLAQGLRQLLAERLLDAYRAHSSDDWPWFEDSLTYNNATLSHALLQCGRTLSRPEMTEAGLRSLAWLATVQRSEEGHFMPVGSNGFYRRGGARAGFDQQPVEAQATLSACLEAARTTGESRWRQEARLAFDWFLGHNQLGLPLYDAATGGCRDGLHADRVNQNQGAESTLSFLLGLQEMLLAEHTLAPVT